MPSLPTMQPDWPQEVQIKPPGGAPGSEASLCCVQTVLLHRHVMPQGPKKIFSYKLTLLHYVTLQMAVASFECHNLRGKS